MRVYILSRSVVLVLLLTRTFSYNGTAAAGHRCDPRLRAIETEYVWARQPEHRNGYVGIVLNTYQGVLDSIKGRSLAKPSVKPMQTLLE